MSNLKAFFLILVVGLISSLYPFLHLGLILGFPSVVINSIILTVLFHNFKKTRGVQ